MDEDWRNTFEILICTEICAGAGMGYAIACHRLALAFFSSPELKAQGEVL